MKVIFYCSYDFSAYGFQFVSVDFEKKETYKAQKADISDEIYTYFTRAGAFVLSGSTEDKRAFFLVKGIKCFDETKQKGEQGHTQDYNLVFLADNTHLDKDIFKLAATILSDYPNFVSSVASMFIVKPEISEGYTVDVEKLETFINLSLTKNEEAKSTGLTKIVDYLKGNVSKSNKFQFAVLFDTWEYALGMYNMSDKTPTPVYCLSKEDFDLSIQNVGVLPDTEFEHPDIQKNISNFAKTLICSKKGKYILYALAGGAIGFLVYKLL